MANVNDDNHPHAEAPQSSPEPPYSALFPNLDKVSKSSFSKGSISRRRINIAAIVLALVLLGVVGLIVFSDAIFR